MKRPTLSCLLPRAGRGFSMIELLVGTGIGLVVLSAVVAAYVATAGIGRASARISELQANGQQAMDVLRRELINAGFRGLTGDPGQLIAATAAITNDCAAGFSMNLRQAVWAADDANPFSATCVPASNYGGGDVLAVRRLGLVPTGALQAGRLHLRSAFQAAQFFVGTTPPADFTFNPAVDYAADAAVYFISPFSASAAESPQVPALYRVRLLPGPAIGAPELVAPGIEELQVRFEVIDNSGQSRLLDPGAAPLNADSNDTGETGWDSVVAVHVAMLVRARGAEAGYAPGERTYTLGSRTVTVNDGIPREVLTSVFSLRNR